MRIAASRSFVETNSWITVYQVDWPAPSRCSVASERPSSPEPVFPLLTFAAGYRTTVAWSVGAFLPSLVVLYRASQERIFLCMSAVWVSFPRSVGLPVVPQTPKPWANSPLPIRTRNPSRRAAADPRLRPLGHWDRLNTFPRKVNLYNISTPMND
jgi:hypothetical protein